jgi:Xaa-Pro dipeptidase
MATTVERLEVPRFSLADRERRWARVRGLMEREGLDVIVAPPHTGHHDHFQANSRYLTGVGGASAEVAAIFPREGEVTAIVSHGGGLAEWLGFQDWVTDVRACNWLFGDGIIARLRELGADQARIGIAGLANIARYPEGVISHGTYVKIREAFPRAELVDATFLLEEAKFVKSDEEIAFLARAVELVEGAIDVMAREAKPGVPECVVYGRMLGSMVEQGGELPTMINWAAGPSPHGAFGMPTQRKLQAGDVILNEVEARWAGYVGQGVQPAVLGRVPADYAEMFQIQQAALDRCYDLLRPGSVIDDLIRVSEESGQGTAYVCRIIVHGRGLGDDLPIAIYGSQDERMKQWRIEENCALIVKPVVMTPDHGKFIFWGDSVVATPGGARRLGQRPRQILELV